MIDLLIRYAPAFGQGLAVTAMLTAIIWTVGISGGVVLGAWARRDLFVGKSLGLVTFVVSALPILVVLMWLFFFLQILVLILFQLIKLQVEVNYPESCWHCKK